MSALTNDLRKDAINRHRERLFGDSSLKVYSITPADGEAEIFDLACDWKGHRVRPTTTGFAEPDSGAWQFQIVAECDWVTSQADMLKAVAVTIDSRRWTVTKVEEPIGTFLVWKLRARIEK